MFDKQDKITFIQKILPFTTRCIVKHQRGFTLLEVMVVLVLIGIIISFATLSLGTGGASQQLELQAQRLAALLQLTNDTAVMQSQELGIGFTDTSYQFYRLDEREWQVITNDDTLRERQLPEGMVVRLTVEDAVLNLNAVEQNPQLLVLSSGEVTPFTAAFLFTHNETLQYSVTANLLGETTVTRNEEQ